MIVLDASAAVALLARTPAGRVLRTRLYAEQDEAHAPHLIDAEVLSALRRGWLRRELEEAEVRQALAEWTGLRVTRYPPEALLPRAWELRANLSAYDALYVALAEVLDAPLLTRDDRLARVPGVRARIELLAPS